MRDWQLLPNKVVVVFLFFGAVRSQTKHPQVKSLTDENQPANECVSEHKER